MIFNKEVGNSGASMVQVMIAFAMVGGLALVMMRINDQGTRTHKSVKARTELKSWLNQISVKYITDGRSCKINFGPSRVYRTNQTNTIGAIYDGDGNPVISIGAWILDVFKLTDMELLPFNSSSSTNTEGICTLELTFERDGTNSANIVGAKIQKHPIDFYCSVDISIEEPAGPPEAKWHPITNCYPSTTSTHNSLWNLSLIQGNEFINWAPSTGLGAVVVGPISPTPIPAGAEPAALNINLDGLSLGSATFPFMEGIGFNINSGVSFGSWYFGAENLGGNFMSMRFWDGEEFHYAMRIYNDRVEFSQGEDDAFATKVETDPTKFRGNAVHVQGGVYATQGAYDNPTGFVGFDHMPKGDPLLSFGLGPYKSYGAGQNLWNEPTSIGAALGLRMTGSSAGEFFMAFRPYSATPLTGVTEIVPNATAPKNFGFRVKHPRNFMFSRDYDYTCSNPPCSDNWIMGDSLGFTGGSHNFLLGSDLVANNSEFNMLMGNVVDVRTSGKIRYSFILGDGLSFIDNAAGVDNQYQFIVGGFGELEGSADDGNHIFATGRGSAMIRGDYTFITGYRHEGFTGEDHATLLGVAMTNSWNQHAVGDFPKFTIGPQFTLMSGGSLMVQTGWDKWGANGPGSPSTLSFSPARHLLSGSPDDYALIGHNYYRMCHKTPVGLCEYFHRPGPTASHGSSFIYMNDIGVFFGDISRAGSTNEARSEVNNKITTAALSGFDRDGLFINDDLNTQSINTDDGQSATVSDTSDKRLKKNIAALTQQEFNQFKLLKAKTYILKKSGKKQHGFIAQEVQKSFPSLVFKRSDGFLSLAYNKMYAFCILWLQNLLSMLEELWQMVESLSLGMETTEKSLKLDLEQTESAIRKLQEGPR